MHVTEVYAMLVCFKGYVCPEALGESCFSSANISRDDNPLGHSLWKMQQEIEKLHHQAVLFLSVRQSTGDVIDVQLCLIFEHALTGLHAFKPQTNYFLGWVILFPRKVIILFLKTKA
jgi:hypothetical protein